MKWGSMVCPTWMKKGFSREATSKCELMLYASTIYVLVSENQLLFDRPLLCHSAVQVAAEKSRLIILPASTVARVYQVRQNPAATNPLPRTQ